MQPQKPEWEPLPGPPSDDNSRRLPWDGGRAIVFFIFSAIVSLLAGVLLVGPLGFYGSVVTAELIAFGLFPAGVCVVFATGWRQWFSLPRVREPFWLWAIVGVLAFAVAQSNLPILIDRLYPMPSGQLEYFQRYLTAQTPLALLKVLLVAALVPAVFEEFTFRGLIQAGLKQTYGSRHAVVWTGFLFSLLHLNPWNFLGLWSFGCFLGYLVERTGSIRPAILLHLVNNSLALAIFAAQGKGQWDKRPEFIAWYWTVLAGLVLVLALWRIHRLSSDGGDHSAAPGPHTPGDQFPMSLPDER